MTRITVAKGDGIGPEIMDATLEILQAAGAKIEIEEIEVGEKVYLAGNNAGISKEAWEVIRRNKMTEVSTNQLLGLGSSQPKSREGSLYMI